MFGTTIANHCAGWLVLPGVLLLLPPGANAAPVPSRDSAWVIDIGDTGGEYIIPSNPQITTRFVFSGKIEKTWATSSPAFELASTAEELSVQPRYLAGDEVLNVHIKTASSKRVSLLIHIVDNNREAVSLVTFRERVGVETDEGVLRNRAELAGAFIQRMKGAEDLAPLETATVSNPILEVATRDVRASGALVGLYFEVENKGVLDFPVDALRLLDRDSLTDYTGGVTLEATHGGASESIGVIPAGARVSGFAFVKNPLARGTRLTMQLRSGTRSVAAQVQYWELVPHMEPEKPKVSVHVQAAGGAIWLGDGIGLEEVDATGVTGLGMRAMYAFHWWIAVEGEILGARTGNAEFFGVTYQGMQGDLKRSATLGRVLLGGVLRLGKKRFIPTVRLGLGVQGASHGAVFSPVGGVTVEPDVGFELGANVHFGAGVDIRLGEHFLAGAGITTVLATKNITAQSTISASIEAGIHLGYVWVQ